MFAGLDGNGASPLLLGVDDRRNEFRTSSKLLARTSGVSGRYVPPYPAKATRNISNGSRAYRGDASRKAPSQSS